MENKIELKEIITPNNLELETDAGGAQLLAVFPNKDYSCYSIIIKGNNYLMFTDERITDNLKLYQYINIIEDNQQKQIKLFYKNYFQKTINNITVTLVQYSGTLNQQNMIKYYDENYFKNVNKNNFLKEIEMHLNALEKDIEMEGTNGVRQTNNGNIECTDCKICCIMFIVVTVFVIILLIFPGLVDILNSFAKHYNNSNPNNYHN
jgi:hypothetical protein